jgi:hypothetical protein
MTAISIPLGTLPRARALSAALVAPSSHQIDRFAIERIGERLRSALTTLSPTRPLTVDRRALQQVQAEGRADRPSAFHWTPATARRTIGLCAARMCADGHRATPAGAVRRVVADLVTAHHRRPSDANSLAGWLATCTTGERTLASANAVTWTTDLMTSLDVETFHSGTIGPPAMRWRPTAGPGVVFRARVELCVHLDSDPSDRALFLLLDGWPGSTSRPALAFDALVAMLTAPSHVPPRRVVAFWPQSGRSLVVDVDESVLEAGATAAVAAVSFAAGLSRQEVGALANLPSAVQNAA